MLKIESMCCYGVEQQYISAGIFETSVDDTLSFYLSKRDRICRVVRVGFPSHGNENLVLFYHNGNYDRATGSSDDLLSLQQTLGFPG